MIKTKKLKLSRKRRLNKRRTNKRRLNKKRTYRRRVNKRLKGGFYRGTIIPQDIVNLGRGLEHSGETFFNNVKGNPVTPSPYPTLDHPIDQPILA